MGAQVSKVAGDTSTKVITVKDIASKLGGSGKPKEALKSALTIEDSREKPLSSGESVKIMVIKAIASYKADTGKTNEALKAAQAIDDPREKTKRIDVLYNAALTVFNNDIFETLKSGNDSVKVRAINDIASSMAKAGLDMNERNKMLHEALKIAQSIEYSKETAKGTEMLRQLFWLKPLQTYPLPVIKEEEKISDSSRISKVSSNTQALYKLLGFNDKNGNGIIETDLDENYDQDADINKDGKIVEAEAKFYLQNLDRISIRTKQRFALTEADRKVLSALFNEALEKIRPLPDLYYKAWAIMDLASRMAKAGLDKQQVRGAFNEAIGTADGITGSPYWIASIHEEIARVMFYAGLDRTDIIKELKKAIDAARAIEDAYGRANTFRCIASDLAKIREDKNKVMAVFKSALEAAAAIDAFRLKGVQNMTMLKAQAEWTIGNIYSDMVEAGFNKSEIGKAFKDAGIKIPR
jgi:hypothetical protein